MLDTYYTTEKALPADLRAVCRLVLATTEAQREAVRVVLEEFFKPTDDGWINGRADAEILAMRDKQQQQRDKANKMWEKRRAAEHVTELGKALAMPRHTESDATASKTDADAMPPTPTPTPTPTPIEKTKTARQRASPAALVHVDVLVEAGFDEDAAAEFIAHKARIKAPLTARAWADHLAESRKAGWHPMQAAIKVIAKNWRGFEAKYVANEARPDWHDKKASEAAKWIRGTSLDRSTQQGFIDAIPLEIR